MQRQLVHVTLSQLSELINVTQMHIWLHLTYYELLANKTADEPHNIIRIKNSRDDHELIMNKTKAWVAFSSVTQYYSIYENQT